MSATPIDPPIPMVRAEAWARYPDQRKCCMTWHMGHGHSIPDSAAMGELRDAIWTVFGLFFLPSCSVDITLDQLRLTPVNFAADVPTVFGWPVDSDPTGGEPAPRAMSVDITIAPFGAFGRSQRNRVYQYGVPKGKAVWGLPGGFDNTFVANRILWLRYLRDGVFSPSWSLLVYSPLTGYQYFGRRFGTGVTIAYRHSRSPRHGGS